MNAESIRTLFQYHHWANRQVWECVEGLSNVQFKRVHDYSIGSVYNQVFHLMANELYTLSLFEPRLYAAYANLKQSDFPARVSIRTHWDYYISRVNVALGNLTDSRLQSIVPMPSKQGTALEAPLWQTLMCMINHATDHRAQILALMHQMGGKTCEQGMFFYLLEQQYAPAQLSA